MKRRELLKAMVTMPIVSALGCSTFSNKPTSASTFNHNNESGI